MNLRSILGTFGLLGALGTGCVVEIAHGPYEACNAGEACSNGTSCTPAMYSATGQAGNICSTACTNGGQCPVSPYGSAYLPTCIVSASAGAGLCYDTCVSDFDCGGGTACATVPGTTARVCVPRGTGAVAPVCGASGQSCCAGSACNAGLACNGSAVCAPVVACGASGQACCASNACGAGLACTAGVCGPQGTVRAPYAKCNAATESCGGATQCIASNIMVAGKSRGTSCSVSCPSGLASSCPGYVAGAPAQVVDCVNATGNLAEAQCFHLCATQNDCLDFNTTCTALPGTTTSVCVPAGARP